MVLADWRASLTLFSSLVVPPERIKNGISSELLGLVLCLVDGRLTTWSMGLQPLDGAG